MQGGVFVLPIGGSVCVFGVAVASGRFERRTARRLSTWTRDYLREVALADLGCAVLGVFVVAQIRSGSNVTSTYLALSLALPVLWIAALWLAGAYDVRFIGNGSDEYRKVLNAGVGLTAAVAIFSYAVNLDLSRGYVVIGLPSVTLFDMVARLGIRKRLHHKRASGKCMHSVEAVGHEPAVADLVTELGRDRYYGRHDRGHALFTQFSVRKDGHSFGIYRFRTMVVDAEQRKAQSLDNNDSDGVLFKLRKDPRVTAVGAHLRRWSVVAGQRPEDDLGDAPRAGSPSMTALDARCGDETRRHRRASHDV